MSEIKEKIWGIGAQFAGPTELYRAAEKVRSAGFRRWDVYSPFPIHGMDKAMGLKSSRVSAVSLAGGITGCLTAFVLVFYPSAIDYPLIVQGKPFFAFEPVFPIFFELTILLTAFATLGGMLLFNLLPRWNHPLFNWQKFEKVTDDGFFLVIESTDPKYSEGDTRKLLEELGGTDVTVVKD